METWGFVGLVLVAVVGLFGVTKLIGRAGRNGDGTHGGGYSSDWSTPSSDGP